LPPGSTRSELLHRLEVAKEPSPRREATAPHYRSADSAPAGFAVQRSPVVALAFLSAMGLLTAVIGQFLPQVTRGYAGLIDQATGVSSSVLLEGASLFLRPFSALFIVLFSLFAAGPLTLRLRLLASGLTLCCAATFAMDCALAWMTLWGGPSPLSPFGGVLSVVGGILVVIWLVFRRFHLPGGVRVRRQWRRPLGERLFVGVALAGSIALLWSGLLLSDGRLPLVSGIPVISRVGSLSLVVVILAGILSMAQLARIRRRRTRRAPDLSVAFVVPAHNEGAAIEECIESLDAAAARYPGPSRAYIVDNASSDDTVEVARAALIRCEELEGTVLSCPTPGKARALNLGLRQAREEIIVRIDADTVVAPSILWKLVPHFGDVRVAAVGGLALPKGRNTWLGSLRTMEVLYSVGFFRLAQGALEGVMVVPGMLAAYRRLVVLRLGGFAEGLNGEDADITIRIGRAGYRVVTDPGIRAFTETPRTLGHLREQRLRWTRGLFHVAARNMSAMWMGQGSRGLWFLPLAVFGGARRAMTLPALVFLIALHPLGGGSFALPPHTLAVGGAVVGLSLIVMIPLLLLYRELPAVRAAPTYIAFHAFRLHMSLETLLTLPVKGKASRVSIPVSALEGFEPLHPRIESLSKNATLKEGAWQASSGTFLFTGRSKGGDRVNLSANLEAGFGPALRLP
jgi:cellulose synthase/poly-beta-1,6-N-acetylglucosamine synthase-like glycosyltransferase